MIWTLTYNRCDRFATFLKMDFGFTSEKYYVSEIKDVFIYQKSDSIILMIMNVGRQKRLDGMYQKKKLFHISATDFIKNILVCGNKDYADKNNNGIWNWLKFVTSVLLCRYSTICVWLLKQMTACVGIILNKKNCFTFSATTMSKTWLNLECLPSSSTNSY